MSDDQRESETLRQTGESPRDADNLPAVPYLFSDLSPEQLQKLRYRLNRIEVIFGLLGALVFALFWLFTRD